MFREILKHQLISFQFCDFSYTVFNVNILLSILYIDILNYNPKTEIVLVQPVKFCILYFL